jgi:hypothetical protein
VFVYGRRKRKRGAREAISRVCYLEKEEKDINVCEWEKEEEEESLRNDTYVLILVSILLIFRKNKITKIEIHSHRRVCS